ncbi:hypothetical protein SAMN05444412_108165 [Rhodonellum ikkaensis]|nr:hypothetical protein SAMN05444412_108165 [Rhodonellum ikkaensis]
MAFNPKCAFDFPMGLKRQENQNIQRIRQIIDAVKSRIANN